MSGRWWGWECLGGVCTSGPGVASWGPNRLDLFVAGTDNGLWHKWYDGVKWRGFEPLGNTIGSAPGAFSRGVDLIAVFTRGADNGLWLKSWNGAAWSSWSLIGSTVGLINDAVGVSSALPTTPLFWVTRNPGTNTEIYGYLDGSTWKGPYTIPGTQPFFDAPASISWGPNRLDIFKRGVDNALWQLTFDHSVQTEASLGGTVIDSPAACSWGEGRLDVFVRGSDNHLYHKWYDADYGAVWSPWMNLGGTITSGPAAVSWGPGRIDVFARGIDNELWHKWWA